MLYRPDPGPLTARFAAIATAPATVVAEVTGLLRGPIDAAVTDQLPLVAWPLIEAARRSPGRMADTVLATLGDLLDAWESRFGLAAATTGVPVSVAAQAWLVQDLHCLADLINHFGAGDGSAWSARGHRAEGLLHARMWRDDGAAADAAYGDLDADGAWHPANDADAVMPLLLLDTPAARVAHIAPRAAAWLNAGRGEPAMVMLLREGLRRHGRNSNMVDG